jgi:hypothetical protein
MRFTESLSKEAAAKTMIPTFGSTNGIDPRAVTNPATFPARLRYLSAFMVNRGGRVNGEAYLKWN